MTSYQVVAERMYDKTISFKCPFCLKDHFFGNCGDVCSTRYEIRGSDGHCKEFDGLFRIRR